MKILIVTGSRHANPEFHSDFVYRILKVQLDFYGVIEELYHGSCSGIDLIAAREAERLGISTTAFPADWFKYGRTAGPRRNREMLEQAFKKCGNGSQCKLLAIPLMSYENRGTLGCVREAERLEICSQTIWVRGLR